MIWGKKVGGCSQQPVYLDLFVGRFFADFTKLNHHQTTIWETIFRTFAIRILRIEIYKDSAAPFFS